MRQEQVNFDTYKHVKDFEESGFNTGQVEALIRVISSSRDFDISRLATKEQLSYVEEKLTAKIDALQKNMTTEIKAMRFEIKAMQSDIKSQIKESLISNLRWTIGLVGSLIVALIGIAYKLLPLRHNCNF